MEDVRHKVEHADDADDAINAACDLEWLATDHLKVMDVEERIKEPASFAETVERILDAAVIADHIGSVPFAAE